MIMSCGLALTRLTSNRVKNMLLLSRVINENKQIVRHGHGQFVYRKTPGPYAKKDYLKAEIVGGIIWWWVLWHCYSEFDELVGYSFPDPSKWTDEELGIPPLDE